MNRRQVMQGMSATLVAALAPEVLIGSATAGGLADQLLDEAGLPDWLHALDAQAERLRSRPVSPVARAWYTGLGLRETAPNDVAESMFRIAAYRDLSPELQAHPELQRRLRHLMPRLGQQVLAMTRFLRDLPDLSRGKVRRLLAENPDLSAAMRHRQRAAMRAAGAPEERVRQTDRLLERLHFRLQRQHPSGLLDELVDKMRRASADVGVAESEWDALIEVDLEQVSMDPVESEAPAPEEGSDATEAPADPYRISRKVALAGGILAAFGVAVFLGGLLFNTAMGIGAYMTITGVVAVLTSLVVLGVALVIHIIEYSRTDGAADADYLLPDDLIAAVRGGEMGLYLPASAPA